MTFLRYLAVQVAAYAIDIGVFFALVTTGVASPLVANVACKSCAGLFAFFAHRSFTFEVRSSRSRLHEAIRYAALLAANVPVSTAILVGVLAAIGNVVVAKVLSDAIAVGLTFVLTRRFVFPREPDDRAGAGDGQSEAQRK